MDNETCTCQKLHARHLLQTTVLCAWGGKVWLKLRGSVICAASTDLTILHIISHTLLLGDTLRGTGRRRWDGSKRYVRRGGAWADGMLTRNG